MKIEYHTVFKEFKHCTEPGGGVSEEQCGFMFRKSTTEVMLALRVLMTLNIWDQPSKRTDSAQERK